MTVIVDPDTIQADQPPTRRRGTFQRLLRKPLGVGALIVLLAMVILGVLSSALQTADPNLASLRAVNAPVGSPGYLLGADQNGRDIWSRFLVSINVSVISALIATSVAVVIGTVFGLIAGYVGRKTDAVTSWWFNLLLTFPGLILVIVLAPITGNKYQPLMVLTGIFLSAGVFRLVRNLVVAVRHELYVDAARVAGLSNPRILRKHILYVIRGPIVITASFLASSAIAAQAGLAFLGIGSTQQASFGSMTADAFANLRLHPVQMVWPSLGLALLTGSLVLVGSAYRDALTGQADAPTRRRKSAATVPGPAPSTTISLDRSNDSDSTTDASTLLSVVNLHVAYPQPDGSVRNVVDGVSLEVKLGEIVGLVGESGSGKTQTAFSILGLLPRQATVAADRMSVAGENLLDRDGKTIRRLRGSVVSYIPQEPMSNLDPSFTIGSQLLAGLTDRMSRAEAKKTILELLDRVGIPDPIKTFKSYPHQISGGMAQRVLIAAAVAPRPKLLIADEPTTALDVTVQAEVLDLLRDLQGELGMGILTVTHNFGVVADLCDRVVVMRAGQVVETGPVRTIFTAPAQPYTRELIGAILDEEKVREDPPSSYPAPTADPSPATLERDTQ